MLWILYVTQLRCVQLLNFYDYHNQNLMLLITKHSFKEQRNTLSTITGNVKGTQIIIYTAQSTDPRHFSIFEPCRAFCFLAKKMMADGCSPSAIQAEGNRQYRLLKDQEWDVYQKIAENANNRQDNEAISKEAQVKRLISSIQANVRVLISVLFPRLFRLMWGNPDFRIKKIFAPEMLSPSNYCFLNPESTRWNAESKIFLDSLT